VGRRADGGEPEREAPSGEAVRGKRVLCPTSDLSAGTPAVVNDPVTIGREISSRVSARWGHCVMGSLPEWAFTIIAVAVGVSPGLAILYLTGSPGYSTAHCGGAPRPDASRRTKSRSAFQGEAAGRVVDHSGAR